MTDQDTLQPITLDPPLMRFSECHQGIVTQLQALAGLPALAAAAERCRRVAAQAHATFEHAVVEHHAEEEAELFPAVLRSAARGEEYERVQLLVRRLTAEHRRIEELWRVLAPAVKAAGNSKAALIDSASVDSLVHACMAHANLEEQTLLPLAEEILGRNGNHMAALGVSIHLRHARQPVGYI
jgi:hemerythrin-like domain-containing protein